MSDYRLWRIVRIDSPSSLDGQLRNMPLAHQNPQIRPTRSTLEDATGKFQCNSNLALELGSSILRLLCIIPILLSRIDDFLAFWRDQAKQPLNRGDYLPSKMDLFLF